MRHSVRAQLFAIISASVLTAAPDLLAQEAPVAPPVSPATAATTPDRPVVLSATGTAPTFAAQVWSNPPPRTERQWYGWQIIIPDAVGVSLVAAGLAGQFDSSGGTALGVSALAILSLDGPIVHIAHRRYAIAAASLGVRVGGAVLGAIIGGLAASGGQHDGDQDVPPGVAGAIFGFGIGAMAGMIADDAGLAWEKVPVAPPHASSPAPFHLALAPIASPTQRGMGVVGTF